MSSIMRKCSDNGQHVRGKEQLFFLYRLATLYLQSQQHASDFLVFNVSLR